MKNENKIKLFLVDDDVVFLKSLEIEFLQHADFAIEAFTTGELCMENLSHNPDVIILDYLLDGIVKQRQSGGCGSHSPFRELPFENIADIIAQGRYPQRPREPARERSFGRFAVSSNGRDENLVA